MKRTTVFAALLVTLAAVCAPVSAHNYAAPLFYLSGVYENVQYPPATDAEMDRLLSMLKDEDAELRSTAAGALGQTGDPRAVEPLIAALQDKSNTVRMNAAFAFCKLKDKRAITALINMLKDFHGDYDSVAAAYALAAIGPEGISAAKEATKDKPAICGDLDDLVAEMSGLTEPPKASVGELLAKLKSGDLLAGNHTLREAEGVVDPQIAEALVPFLSESPEYGSRAAAYALAGKNATFVMDKLLAIANSKASKARAGAFIALRGQNDPRVTQAVLAALKEPKMAQAALAAVGKGSDGKLIAAAIEALKSPEDYTPCVAAQALMRAEDPKGIQAIVQVMQQWDGDTVYSFLRDLGYGEPVDPRLLDGLIGLLSHKDSEAQRSALRLIGQIGDRKATRYIIPLLDNSDVRGEAIAALGELKDPAALPALIAQFKPVKPTGTRADQVDNDLHGALVNYGADGVEAFIRALSDPDAHVRAGVSRVFTQIKDPRAVDPLIRLMADKSPEVRASAASALGVQGDVKAVEVLIKALKDTGPGVRGEAAGALVKLRDRRAAEPLAALLNDRDLYLRACAGVGLGLLGDARGADLVVALLKGRLQREEGADSESGYRLADLQIPAIEAAGKLKDERTIKPIVQRLGEDCSMSVFDGKSEEEMAKSREAKIQALKQITGQDFGHAYYRWIAYAEYTT